MARKPQRHRSKSGKKGRTKDRVPPKLHPDHNGIRIETHGPHSGDTAFRYVLFVNVGEGTAKRRVDLAKGFGTKGSGRTGALHAGQARIDNDTTIKAAADEARTESLEDITNTTTSQTEAA